MEQLRIGVIGLGNMGTYHAQNISKGTISHCRLTAVCDVDEGRLDYARTEFPDAARFCEHTALIQSGLVDAVIIATPHYFHSPIAVDCFHEGLHVLSEKPAGVYANQVYAMNEAAKAAGTVFGIMLNQRTEPIYQKMRSMIQNGILGKLQRFHWTVCTWYRDQAYYDSSSWRATWDGEGGGVLINQAMHNLDVWQWMLGMPEKLTAFCGFGKYHKIQTEDEAIVYAEYADGLTAQFVASTGEPFGVHRMEITGELGRLTAENGRLTLLDKDRIPKDVTPKETGAAHIAILQNFVNAILFGEELIAPGTDGVYSVELCNAALLSAWEGRTVTLPVDSDHYQKKLMEKASDHFAKEDQTERKVENHSHRWQVKW